MFRLTEYMQQLVNPTPVRLRNPDRAVKPVVIWNLTRRCNLKCRHCYTVSADVDFPGELSQEQAFDALEDLGRFRVPAIILSGGEPLDSPYLFPLAERARKLTRVLALSTNGTRIYDETADMIADGESAQTTAGGWIGFASISVASGPCAIRSEITPEYGLWLRRERNAT